jgi:hypothetical protein
VSPDLPPGTKHGTRPVVAIVMKPIKRHEPLGRGCTVTDEHGGLHRMTADVVHAIDFYPATPATTTTGEPRAL